MGRKSRPWAPAGLKAGMAAIALVLALPGSAPAHKYWVPSPGGLPRGALLALGVVVIAAIAFVEVVRRRRRGRERNAGGASHAWGQAARAVQRSATNQERNSSWRGEK
jgi:hypothetical protein